MTEIIIDKENSSNLKLAKEIHKENGLSGSSPQAYSFIITSLSILNRKDFNKNELLDIITDGQNDYNIDAIYFNKNYLDVYSVSNNKLTYPELNTLNSSIKSAFVGNLEKKDPKLFKSLNDKVKKSLKKFYQSNEDKEIRIFVIYKDVVSRSVQNKIESIKKDMSGYGIEFNFLRKEDLVDKILESENFLEEFKFNISQKNILLKSEESLIFKVSILDLLKLQDESLKNNSDLFNKNIRIFLNNKSLAKKFKSTIEQEPENFYLFNNGITIVTTDNINNINAGKVLIKKPQVVNGAQTINSLYNEFGYDPKNKNLAKASVIVKIIKADKEFTKKVCETANTQLPIKLWDLRANDDIHKKLELFFGTEGYHYLRKTRQKARKESRSGVPLVKFIQWFYSVKYKKPADAKNKKKMLFEISSTDGLYKSIESDLELILDTDPEYLLKIIEVALFVDEKIKKEENKVKKGLLRDADLHIIMILFIKKDTKKFNKVVKYIEKYVSDVKRKNPEITNNKIFTKSDDLAKKLLSNI